MKRDILDWQGQVIGELELPDETPEEFWQSVLAPYAIAPADQLEIAWKNLRQKRLSLMIDTKWIRSRHEEQKMLGVQTSLTEEQYTAWLAYWQALRDLPENTANPFEVNWPEQPT